MDPMGTLVDYRWSGQLITSLKRLVNHLQISNLHLLGHVQAVSTMRTIYGATGHAMSLRTILIWIDMVGYCSMLLFLLRNYPQICVYFVDKPHVPYYILLYQLLNSKTSRNHLSQWHESRREQLSLWMIWGFWGVLVGPGWTGLVITQQVPRVPRLEAKSDALQHVSRDVCISSFHLGREKKTCRAHNWCPQGYVCFFIKPIHRR